MGLGTSLRAAAVPDAVTFSGTGTGIEAQKQAGGSWSTDGSGTVINGTGSGTAATCGGIANGTFTVPALQQRIHKVSAWQ